MPIDIYGVKLWAKKKWYVKLLKKNKKNRKKSDEASQVAVKSAPRHQSLMVLDPNGCIKWKQTESSLSIFLKKNLYIVKVAKSV